MSRQLAPPTRQLAGRLLAAHPYDSRLRVGRLIPPVGITAGDVRSVHELHAHLAPDARSLPGVSLAGAADWIESVVADPDLAAVVRALAAEPLNYVDTCLRLHELLGARLEQAEAVAGGERMAAAGGEA